MVVTHSLRARDVLHIADTVRFVLYQYRIGHRSRKTPQRRGDHVFVSPFGNSTLHLTFNILCLSLLSVSARLHDFRSFLRWVRR